VGTWEWLTAIRCWRRLPVMLTNRDMNNQFQTEQLGIKAQPITLSKGGGFLLDVLRKVRKEMSCGGSKLSLHQRAPSDRRCAAGSQPSSGVLQTAHVETAIS